MRETRYVRGWDYGGLPFAKLDMTGRISWKRDDDFLDDKRRSHFDQFFNWRIDQDDNEFVIRFSRKPEAPSGGHINVDMKIEGGLTTQPDGSVVFDGGVGDGEGNKVSKFSLSFEISHESPPHSESLEEEWKQPEEREIKFFHHPEHKLLLAPENHYNDVHMGKATCDACTEPISEGNARWVYMCSDNCDYGVHAKCAQLARTIRHPSHLKHNLQLLKLAPGCYRICNLCKGLILHGLHYNCTICDFDLHPECPERETADSDAVKEMTAGEMQMQLILAQQRAASMWNAGQALSNLIG